MIALATEIARILVTLVCLGLVVVIHEGGHFVVARWIGVRVERFTVGFGPELFGWTIGQTRYAVCSFPLGGMVKLAGELLEESHHKPDEFFSQPWYRRAGIALAGPVMNYLLAFILFAGVAGIWGVMQPSEQPVVGDLVVGLPASAAHLRIGDRIDTVDHQPVTSWQQMANLIHQKPGERVTLEIERAQGKGGAAKKLTVTLTPKRDPQRGLGLIGIMPQVERAHVGLRGALKASAEDIKVWTLQPLKYVSQKIRRWEPPKELSGPLGIWEMTEKATKEGVSYVVYLMAIISTGLGLFNLFPIPILDGGHIFLYTIEGIIRRPLSPRAMQVANAIGLSLILTIFIYASYQDYLRRSLGFWK
jgi:regulator of sigma E protease